MDQLKRGGVLEDDEPSEGQSSQATNGAEPPSPVQSKDKETPTGEKIDSPAVHSVPVQAAT